MTEPSNGPQATWRVTSQISTPQVGPSGRPEQGMQIFYTTGAGNSGSAWVPLSQYTNQVAVKAAIQAAANHTDWVSSLTSES